MSFSLASVDRYKITDNHPQAVAASYSTENRILTVKYAISENNTLLAKLLDAEIINISYYDKTGKVVLETVYVIKSNSYGINSVNIDNQDYSPSHINIDFKVLKTYIDV